MITFCLITLLLQIITHYYKPIITYYYEIIITHYYIIFTSFFCHYYVIITYRKSFNNGIIITYYAISMCP